MAGRPTTSNKGDCIICQDKITDRAVIMPCMHEFDKSCIQQWFSRANKCPVCRATAIELYTDIKSDADWRVRPVVETVARGREWFALLLESDLDNELDGIERRMQHMEMLLDELLRRS